VIKSFKHRGLKKFYETGSAAGIQPGHANKLQLILTQLAASQVVSDMDVPIFRLHELRGKRKGVWSVWVNGNWRVTFKFLDGYAEVINYEDYH